MVEAAGHKSATFLFGGCIGRREQVFSKYRKRKKPIIQRFYMVKYPKNPAFTAKNTPPPPPPDLGKGSARARNGNFFSRRLYYYDTEQKENQAILALAGGQSLQRWLLPIPKALKAIPIPNKPSVSPRRHPCTKKAPPYPILAEKTCGSHHAARLFFMTFRSLRLL